MAIINYLLMYNDSLANLTVDLICSASSRWDQWNLTRFKNEGENRDDNKEAVSKI